MSHILGNKFCIESLIKDVQDVQDALEDVVSHTGRVNFQSWKFPDKLSIDVEVSAILELCVHDEGCDEDNQICHITLYDLLIDRLLLLLQCFICFNEKACRSDCSSDLKSSDHNQSISVGSTAKKSWFYIKQMSSCLQQLSSPLQQTKENEEKLQKEILLKPTKELLTKSEAQLKLEAANISSHKTKMKDKSNQTLQTCLTSCEICSITQQCLLQVARSIVSFCKSLNLPTSLENYIGRIDQNMSIAEINRLKGLQCKDLSRVDRQVQKVMKEILPLQKALEDSKVLQEETMEEVKKEKKIIEGKEKEFLEKLKQNEIKWKQELKTIQIENKAVKASEKALNQLNHHLNEDILKLKEEIVFLQRNNYSFESENKRLKEEKIAEEKKSQNFGELTSKYQTVTNEIKLKEKKIESLQDEIEMEKKKNDKLNLLEKNQQKKHQMLLEKFQRVVDESDCLRDTNSKIEEENFDLVEKFENLQRLNNKLETDLKLLEAKSKSEIKDPNIDSKIKELEELLQESQSRERLLAVYPEMCTKPEPIKKSDDVVEDMKQQLKANQLRIELLETENINLRTMLQKISEANLFEKKPILLYSDLHLDGIKSNDEDSQASFSSCLTTSTLHHQPKFSPTSRAQKIPNDADSIKRSFVIGSSRRPPSSNNSARSNKKPWM